MTDKEKRKTRKMQRVEAMHGRLLEELIPDLYRETPSLQRVATKLDIDITTLVNWNRALGIRIETLRTARLAS